MAGYGTQREESRPGVGGMTIEAGARPGALKITWMRVVGIAFLCPINSHSRVRILSVHGYALCRYVTNLSRAE